MRQRTGPEPSRPRARLRYRLTGTVLTALGLTFASLAGTGVAATAAAPSPAPSSSAASTPTTQSQARGQGSTSSDSLGTGPTGWDTYRQLNQLPMLSQGVQTEQSSSFDRQQANNDFSHCLNSTPTEGCVLAQHDGPGEIEDIWNTGADPGNLHVVLDGRTVIDAPYKDIVAGKLGSPFVYPLVADSEQTPIGQLVSVPMPFRSSMLVYTDANPLYYHVVYRTFADSQGVTTFDPTQGASDVVSMFQAAGTRDPKGSLPGETTSTTKFTIQPGATATLGSAHGPGEVTGLQLTVPQLVDPSRTTTVGDNLLSQPTGELPWAGPFEEGVGKVAGTVTPTTTSGGASAVEWVGSETPDNTWIQVTDNSLTPGEMYRASITLQGEGDIYLDFYDGNNDLQSAAIQLSSTPRTVTVDTSGLPAPTGRSPQFEVRTATEGPVDVVASDAQIHQLVPVASASAIADTNAVLEQSRLRMSFDGQRTVDSPLGEFFGTGLGNYAVRSLMFAADPTTDTYSAWWPMPYQSDAEVSLYNGSNVPITLSTAQLSTAPNPLWIPALSSGVAGYFRTTSHAGPTTANQDWNWLDPAGEGKYVGVTQDMRSVNTLVRNYLEGNARGYVDGSSTPQWNGTGTEDYFEGGYYFEGKMFTNPLQGSPTHLATADGCQEDCTDAYRVQIADAVPFGNGLNFGIQHGPTDDVPADYSTTAYWYGPSPRRATEVGSDSLTVGDPASEAAHGYTSTDPGAVRTLSETFEGRDGPQQPVTATARQTTAAVSFHMALDPRNIGVTLRRLSDQLVAYQQASVSVDGQPVGTWLEPLNNPYHQWLDDYFQIPARYTLGHREITVTLTPSAGSPPWSAAHYWAFSSLPPQFGPR